LVLAPRLQWCWQTALGRKFFYARGRIEPRRLEDTKNGNAE